MKEGTPVATAVDLFCGIGGLTRGLIDAGVDVAGGFDVDGSCKYAYETNNGSSFVEKDVREITAEDILSMYPEGGFRVLVGCAPCQPFSGLSHKNKRRREDERWGLLDEFARLVLETRPDVVSMENVPNLRNADPFKRLLDALEGAGYRSWYDVVRCEEYGVPQRRRRLVLLASGHGPIRLIPLTVEDGRHRTVRDAIGDLPELGHGESDESDPFHVCQRLSERNLERIRASVPGGTWRDWREELRPECFKRESGKSYSPVYGRMEWDKPAPTITTQFYNYGSGRFGHPDQDRGLSLREGAMLQSFPEGYELAEDSEDISLSRMGVFIGNAVPVRLGEAIGRNILGHLESAIHSRFEGGS